MSKIYVVEGRWKNSPDLWTLDNRHFDVRKDASARLKHVRKLTKGEAQYRIVIFIRKGVAQ